VVVEKEEKEKKAAKRDQEEEAVEREEKAKKVKRDQEAEVATAVAEVAVEKEEKVKRVKIDQPKKVIDQEAEAEVEVEADHKVPKVKLLKVMKVFFTLKRKRDLITLAKMSISKEREENNGIQWTEDQVPEEVEVQPRMVTEEVTGAPLRMKSSKPKVSLLKVRPLPLLK
jgi:hypothetical protein